MINYSQDKISVKSIERVIQSALTGGYIRDEDSAVILYDLTFLENRIRRLVSCFPDNTLHALAIKANPLIRILDFVNRMNFPVGPEENPGMEKPQKRVRCHTPKTGVEAASLGEVNLALKTGCLPDQIVFDSPVKTRAELEFAIKTGIHINVDNLSELERIREILAGSGRKPNAPADITVLSNEARFPGSIGIRINPQIGVGTILESSVAGEYSKFGVPIRYQRVALEKAFLSYEWLTGVHLHVGSQGCSMNMLIDGIGILYDFVTEINVKRLEKGFTPVFIFDIGGGLPVSYEQDTVPPAMEDYAAAIRMRAPGLFGAISPGPKTAPHVSPSDHVPALITEFGRWTYTNAGWTMSRVEYVKHDQTINTAMLHVGADLFVRECLNPNAWKHEYSVYDRKGKLKAGVDKNPYNLAGPLCFAGDILAKEVRLPKIEEGDYVVVHDTGGYTFSMWSRYNSRQIPRVLGYQNEGKNFEILKERETFDDIYSFWK
ncbi:MAG: hypothetical protein M0P58_08510 [Bacteroidales bacterium]|nr:hypothetical protein [Bacteroidales bacterium]